MQDQDSQLKFSLSHTSLKIATSIIPFKSSINKNPSFFTMTRSPELLTENKKLKEENNKLIITNNTNNINNTDDKKYLQTG